MQLSRPAFGETFGVFNSFSLKEVELKQSGDLGILNSVFRDRDNDDFYDEESAFDVMGFKRGTSEAYESIFLGNFKESESRNLEGEVGTKTCLKREDKVVEDRSGIEISSDLCR